MQLLYTFIDRSNDAPFTPEDLKDLVVKKNHTANKCDSSRIPSMVHRLGSRMSLPSSQPRDGDPRASYLLYNQADSIALHRWVSYDLKQAVARFKKARLPAENSSRLLIGE
jgi:hypothetical protein